MSPSLRWISGRRSRGREPMSSRPTLSPKPSVMSTRIVYRVRCLITAFAARMAMRLIQREIPFILHSGYEYVSDACHGGIVVPKPAKPEVLIEALLGALR